MKNKYLNIRIGKDLYDLLIQQPSFQSNWKSISAAYYILNRIFTLNEMNDGKPSRISRLVFSDTFRPYNKTGEYKKYIDDMERCGLIITTNDYFHDPNVPENSQCKSYLITDLGINLLLKGDLEYLKVLHGDKTVQRRIQKSISNRKVLKKTYNDTVINHIQDLLVNLSVKMEDLSSLFNENQTNLQQRSISSSVINIKQKEYIEPNYCDKNGRLTNSYTIMKTSLKNILIYTDVTGQEYTRRYIVDARSCWPTYFSTYILTKYILGHNFNVKMETIQEEHKKWVELFTGEEDPKNIIAKELGIDRAKVKKAMNYSLSMSKQEHEKYFPNYINWMRTEFPNLFSIWYQLPGDIRQTGNNIAKEYESVLFADPKLYMIAESMYIKVGYENDGFSVFAPSDETDKSIQDHVNILTQYIQCLSKRMWNVPVVLTVKQMKGNE